MADEPSLRDLITDPVVGPLIQRLMGNGPVIVKSGGRVYQVGENGQASEVQGIPPETARPDTNPTSIHVPGRGWLEWFGPGDWRLVPGTEETPEAPRETITEGGDGKKYVVKSSPNGPPVGVEIAGIPGNSERPPSVVSPGQGVRQPDGTYTVPVPARENQPPATVAPGHGVRQPDGTYTVPVPDANQETPADRTKRETDLQTLRGSQAVQQILVASDARQKEARAKLKADLDAGVILPKEYEMQLQATYDQQLAEIKGEIDRTNRQQEHDLEQPNKDRTFGIQERNAATAERTAANDAARAENDRINREREARFNASKEQVGVLTKQSEHVQSNIQGMVKAGVAPSAATLRLSLQPMQEAFNIMNTLIENGQLTPSNMPTRQAPAPATDPRQLPPLGDPSATA